MSREHLAAIDADTWPGIATVPRSNRVKTRMAEAAFARGCEAAGIELEPDDPDLIVDREELFARLADAGWLGLAESYVAGEWRTQDSDALVDVLAALIAADYAPRASTTIKPRADEGGELPPELIRLYGGAGMSAFGAVFASGVPTTVRSNVTSYAPGAGRRGGPASHFVDVTDVAEPAAVDTADLADGQQRAVEKLLDATQVGSSTHVLEYPSTGGAAAIAAAQRQATVDTLTSDPTLASAINERLTLAGVADSVHTEVISKPVATLQEWRGRYDAVIGVEKMETLPGKQREDYVEGLDRMLAVGGRVGLQTVVATSKMNRAAAAATQMLNAYVWPGLEIVTIDDLNKLFDRKTGLRITAETHFGSHYELTMQLQRRLFEVKQREAAAEGFDRQFRRLWVYQFALREALFRLGILDAVQLTLRHRNRGGLR